MWGLWNWSILQQSIIYLIFKHLSFVLNKNISSFTSILIWNVIWYKLKFI